MDWLVTGAALVLASTSLFVLTLRAAADLLRALREQARSLPTEGVSSAIDTAIDDVESS
jgi:hypothetical protein